MKGNFITLEGCEGVGKSRQTQLLSEYLDKKNIPHITVREPGGNDISERIRSIILDKSNVQMSAECEALLYAASRAQLIKEVIKPALTSGKTVICDRYIHSSFAYQGYARGLGFEFIKSVNIYAYENCMPDLTFFLDLPANYAFLRKGGIDEHDRLENSGLDFHERVYEGYKKLFEIFKGKIIRIDAAGTKEQTHEKIVKEMEYLILNME